MNSPLPFSWFATNEHMTDHVKYPENIFIDIGEMITIFFDEISCYDEYEHPLDEIFNDVIGYLSTDAIYESALQALREFIFSCYAKSKYPETFAKTISDAVFVLAKTLRTVFKRHGLYDEVGILPYRLGSINRNTLIMIKVKFEDCLPTHTSNKLETPPMYIDMRDKALHLEERLLECN